MQDLRYFDHYLLDNLRFKNFKLMTDSNLLQAVEAKPQTQ